MDKILKKLLEDGLINQKTYKTLQRWPQAKLISFLNILIKDEQIAIHDQEGTSIKEIDPNEVESALEGRYIDISIPVPESLQDYQEAKLDDYIERYKPTQSTKIKRLPDGTYGEVTEYNWELAPQYQDDEAITQTGEMTTDVEIQEEMDVLEATDPAFKKLTEKDEEILKKAPLGRLTGQQFIDYKTQIESGSTPEDAYEWVTGQILTRFATDADGNVLFEGNIPVPIQAQPNSLFMNGRDGFINHIKEQNPQVIEALKNQMIGWGIADEDDFDDSGEVDEFMEQILGMLIDTANSRYSHITAGDAEWKALVDSVPANFGWVEDDNMDSEKFSWAMLGKIMVDWRDIEELQADTATKTYKMGLRVEKPKPGKSYMTLQLNQWFEEETGRLPTQEELTGYMEDWLGSHDEYIQKSGAAYRAAQYGAQYEQYLLENDKSILPEDIKALEDDIQAGGDVLTGLIGTREVATDVEDPFYTTMLSVQTDLKTEKDRIEAADAKRNNQREVLKIMTGNI